MAKGAEVGAFLDGAAPTDGQQDGAADNDSSVLSHSFDATHPFSSVAPARASRRSPASPPWRRPLVSSSYRRAICRSTAFMVNGQVFLSKPVHPIQHAAQFFITRGRLS